MKLRKRKDTDCKIPFWRNHQRSPAANKRATKLTDRDVSARNTSLGVTGFSSSSWCGSKLCENQAWPRQKDAAVGPAELLPTLKLAGLSLVLKHETPLRHVLSTRGVRVGLGWDQERGPHKKKPHNLCFDIPKDKVN